MEGSHHAELHGLCAPCHAGWAPCVPYGLAQPALSVSCKAPFGLGRYAAPASHEEALPSGSQSSGWLPSCFSEVPEQLADWLAAHALSASRDLHLLSLAVGVLLSLSSRTKQSSSCEGSMGPARHSALRFSLLSLHYASRENTTIVAMATFVQELLPRAPDDAWPKAIRLLSHTQARTSESTDLDARDTDKNQQIWNAKLVLATTGLHLAQFRQPHRPLAKAVDYADLFIHDEAQQEAALSDLASLEPFPANVWCSVLVTPSKPLEHRPQQSCTAGSSSL